MDLVIKKNDREIHRIELESGTEYIAGRAPDCAILLDGEKGISRQHIKFFDQNGVWIVQLMSRFGGLIYQGESVQALELTVGAHFSMPPYEFAVVESLKTVDEAPKNSMIIRSAPAAAIEAPIDNEMDMDFSGNIEATQAGLSQLQAYLKVFYGSSRRGEVFRLEGHVWNAGRDPHCEIFLDDRHISRRHFELTRTKEGFFVTDLESANGTAVNGDPLTSHEPYKILSGDKITIMDIEIDFEVRDTQFENKMSLIPQNKDLQSGGPTPYQQSNIAPLPVAVAGPAVERIYPHHHSLIERFKRFDYKRNRIRIVIGAVSFVGLIGLMSSPNKNVKKVGEMSSPSIDTAIPFDKLSPENKSAVKDTFNLARNLYVTGKYELCLEELKKLHNLVPFYENSKELVNLCTQGSDFAKIKADLDYKQQEKMRREREIQAITESCQDKLSKNPSLPEDDLQSCLAPAIELDPENAKVVELTTLLKVRQEERQEKQRQSQVYRERVQKTEALYSIAKQKLKSGKLRDAVDEYDRILNSSLPDVNGIKSKAQRELSSVRKQLEEKVGHLLAVCQDNLEKTHFRAAYNACFEATQEDPKNQTAQVTLQRSLSELRREMKAVYEDSVLEESLGNIDAAKEKWKRLMQEDLPTDDYSIKSKLKLQKYGIGI